MMAHATTIAESKFGGNLSRYLQSLIEADMKGGTAPATDGGDLSRMLGAVNPRWGESAATYFKDDAPLESAIAARICSSLLDLPAMIEAQREADADANKRVWKPAQKWDGRIVSERMTDAEKRERLMPVVITAGRLADLRAGDEDELAHSPEAMPKAKRQLPTA